MERTDIDRYDFKRIRTAAVLDSLIWGSTQTLSGVWVDDQSVHYVLVRGLEASPGSRAHSCRLLHSDVSVCLRSAVRMLCQWADWFQNAKLLQLNIISGPRSFGQLISVTCDHMTYSLSERLTLADTLSYHEWSILGSPHYSYFELQLPDDCVPVQPVGNDLVQTLRHYDHYQPCVWLIDVIGESCFLSPLSVRALLPCEVKHILRQIGSVAVLIVTMGVTDCWV